MSRTRRAWLAFSSSAVVCTAAAWLVLSMRRTPTVVIAETSNAVAILLDSRRALAGERASSASWPPALDRESLGEAAAAVLYPQIDRRRFVYDPLAHFRPVQFASRWRRWDEHPAGGWKVSQNSLGMRGSREPRADAPDLRVLAVGDSHAFGLCSDKETFAHRLELLLADDRQEQSVEVLNASAGGYDPFNYLGVVERYEALAPDAVVVVLYGGNDFSGVMSLERYFHRRGRPEFRDAELTEMARSGESARVAIAQVLSQLVYFRRNPADEVVAEATLAAIALELQLACTRTKSELLCVYLPPAGTVQEAAYMDLIEPPMRALDLERSDLDLTDRLADAWLRFLAERAIHSLDLRPLFEASEEGCYWRTDLHLNLHGHELVANAVRERLNDLLP